MLVSPTIQHLHGRLLSITGTDPASGAEISLTVPARRRWKIISIRFVLVTDATVVDRTVRLKFDDGTIALFHIASDTVQTASQERKYEFKLQPVPQFLVATDFHLPLPHLSLAAGFRIITITLNLQAGDNLSAPQLLVEEWIDP